MTSAAFIEARVHRCGPIKTPVKLGTKVERLPWTTIDVHSHLLSPSVEALVAGHPKKLAEQAALTESMGAASFDVNGRMIASLLPRFGDIDLRLNDMDAMGVDFQAISPSPTQYYSWAEPELAERIADCHNMEIAALCESHPDRFLGLGAVSMQYPERAAAQLETLMLERGFKGVEISTLVNNQDISDRTFDPFWAKADELAAIVFIHPWGSTLGKRLADHYLINTIGQPFETSVCLSKLIFSGTLDRYKKLKIVAAHGGGYLPLYAGRSDHARAIRPEVKGCGCLPSDYLTRIWYDSLVYNPESLARLIDQVGQSRILIGTDYPFDMGHYDPRALLAPFDEAIQRLVSGENAVALFGIDVSRTR
jgi:aminocarboxymuconate-semialdehyde decarboxylase